MSEQQKIVCIFCASSCEVCSSIKKAGEAFAGLLAKRGHGMLFGGTSKGFMKTNADAYLKNGGTNLIGVIPNDMVEKKQVYPKLDKIVVVDSIRQRKAKMLSMSDAFVALPGGIGTMDEFFDILTLKYLKEHNKPMFLLNTDLYYQPLLDFFALAVKQKTIKPETLALFNTALTPESLAEQLF